MAAFSIQGLQRKIWIYQLSHTKLLTSIAYKQKQLLSYITHRTAPFTLFVCKLARVAVLASCSCNTMPFWATTFGRVPIVHSRLLFLWIGEYVPKLCCMWFTGCNESAVRLIDGENGFEGRVELCMRGEWGTVCSISPLFWGPRDAEVVCRQLEKLADSKWSNPIEVCDQQLVPLSSVIKKDSCWESMILTTTRTWLKKRKVCNTSIIMGDHGGKGVSPNWTVYT